MTSNDSRNIRLSCVQSDDGGFAVFDADDYSNYSTPLSVVHPTSAAADWIESCITFRSNRKQGTAFDPGPTSPAVADAPTPAATPNHIEQDEAALTAQKEAINKAWRDL